MWLYLVILDVNKSESEAVDSLDSCADDSENRPKTDWSSPDGEPPSWWEKEVFDDGDLFFFLNGERSYFQDDSDEDLATRLWGATLYARELRLHGPEHLLTMLGPEMVWRALYGYCCENACVLRSVLEDRGFDVRCIAVMTQGDIRQCLGGDCPESVRETSYRHYLVQVRDPQNEDKWITCDSSQYRYDTHDSTPYVSPELPEEYVWFDDSIELGESVLGTRDPEYCMGSIPDDS